MAERNIVIVTGRCAKSKQCFGIRLERRAAKQWGANWAFALKEIEAKKEGYDKTRVRGTFVIEQGYPGCPHCRAAAFFLCECGKVGCHDGESKTVVCPWCGQEGILSGTIDSLDAGTDR